MKDQDSEAKHLEEQPVEGSRKAGRATVLIFVVCMAAVGLLTIRGGLNALLARVADNPALGVLYAGVFVLGVVSSAVMYLRGRE